MIPDWVPYALLYCGLPALGVVIALLREWKHARNR